MSLGRQRMEQDELEEDILLHSVVGHLQLLGSLLQSSPTLHRLGAVLCRLESVILLCTLILLLFALHRRNPERSVLSWFSSWLSFLPLLISDGVGGRQTETEWSEVGPRASIYSMQGRRPNNEDRAVSRAVSLGTRPPVHVFAVLDGHGGEFAADFAQTHLLSAIETRIHQLKILTGPGSNTERLKQFEEHFQEAPATVLKFLKISKTEEKEEKKDSSEKENESRESSKEGEEMSDDVRKKCRGPVLGSREKSIEEVPSLSVRMARKTMFKPKTPVRKSRSSQRGKDREGKQEEEPKAVDITEYISSQGEILYAKLLKDEVLRCDSQLITAAKKKNAIGGTTLIMAVLDSGQLWVANVGDSRGVYGNRCGVAVPMSYDHKPCQLKEKKRIQEAGGFVAMNGVWRVQGVLATSRALGDYPLKDKKVVVADPDVLNFSVSDHRMQFAVLASDGLWDTHSNEEAVSLVRGELDDSMRGARRLAEDAHSRGSLDNVTVLVIDLRGEEAAK